MRLAFGQSRSGERGCRGERGETQAIVEQLCRVTLDHLTGEEAEMLGETRAPSNGQAIADLPRRAGPGRLAAAQEPGVAAVLAGQKLHDERALAMNAAR